MVFITAVAVLLVDIVQIDNIAIKSLDTVLVGVNPTFVHHFV